MPFDSYKKDVCNVIICHNRKCRLPFFKGPKDKPYRKFCSRMCYRKSRQASFHRVPYPMIWHNGRRELLHRVIYMQHTGETLGPNDIVHHKDENPFNRHPSNLERISGERARADHLRKHNYHRPRGGFDVSRRGGGYGDFSEFGW